MTTTIDGAVNDAIANKSRADDRASGGEQRAVVKPAVPRKLPPLVTLRSYDWMDHHALFSKMDC